MADERARKQSGGRSATSGPEWLTLGETARYLGVAQSTVRKWSDGGRLPAFYTPGGHRRFRRQDLDGFLAGSRTAPARAEQVVLVVDDDEGVRALVRESLEREGYAVREAASAAAGLAAIEELAPDLVLVDVMMPEIDGWEMLRRVHERHGPIPVVVFSGKVDEAAAGQAQERGAQAFVGKPFDPKQLVETARQLLRA